MPGLPGVYGCVASSTGIPNCLSLIIPGTIAGKSGCFYCSKGYNLIPGTPVNGVTPYTCQLGSVANCAFYNMHGALDADLLKCRYCETGFQIAQDPGDTTIYTCSLPADPGDLVDNCLHQGWDAAVPDYGCGICEEKYFIGTRAGLSSYCITDPTNNPRGCLDDRSASDPTACGECAWMIG